MKGLVVALIAVSVVFVLVFGAVNLPNFKFVLTELSDIEPAPSFLSYFRGGKPSNIVEWTKLIGSIVIYPITLTWWFVKTIYSVIVIFGGS